MPLLSCSIERPTSGFWGDGDFLVKGATEPRRRCEPPFASPEPTPILEGVGKSPKSGVSPTMGEIGNTLWCNDLQHSVPLHT